MCIDSTSESSSQTVQYVNRQWYEELGKHVSNSRDSLDRAALKQDMMFTVFFTTACGHSNFYSIRNAYCRSVVVVVVQILQLLRARMLISQRGGVVLEAVQKSERARYPLRLAQSLPVWIALSYTKTPGGRSGPVSRIRKL